MPNKDGEIGSGDNSPGKKKKVNTRTRKTPEEKLAELENAEQQLKARKQALKAQLSARKRKEDARRKVIYGAVVLAHAEVDENFASLLSDIIYNHTTREADRKFLGLPPLGSDPSSTNGE